ncbi:hypothetical protein KSP39_PZI016305 [Platanthera zijinensis]|uniref:Reverse transcriptase zinc-binding domain-containing protein n=1 Tax=Platanthera zijinensis TaxID=2320716 RepID=A0AAP0B6L0_9ASPA
MAYSQKYFNSSSPCKQTAGPKWLLAEHLHVYFGDELAARITRLPCDNVGGSDKLILLHSESRNMNTAVVYKEECQRSSLSGGEIWKLKAQPRILAHAWRAYNNLLATHDWLHFHKLRSDACCPWGCEHGESISHTFGECKFFKKFWKECSRLSIVPTIPTGTCLARLFAEAADNKKYALAIFLASIVYYTWKERNCFIHGEPYLQASAIAIKALHDANIGSWNVHCNQQTSWTSRLLDGCR